jgi:hypothetical protein
MAAIPVDTAAAAPPEDPPDVRSGFHGLHTSVMVDGGAPRSALSGDISVVRDRYRHTGPRQLRYIGARKGVDSVGLAQRFLGQVDSERVTVDSSSSMRLSATSVNSRGRGRSRSVLAIG